MANMETTTIAKLKVLFFGPEGSGKSSLVRRLVTDTFESEYHKTSGIEIGGNFEQDNTRIQIWDAAGDEAMKNIVRSYYRPSQMAVLCFDCRKKPQFEQLPEKVKEFKEMWQPADGSTKDHALQLLLVSTHSDCEGERQVSPEEAEKFATDQDMHFLNFSNRNGTQAVIRAKIMEMAEKWRLSKQV